MDKERIIDACLELSRKQEEGCLFVIQSQKPKEQYFKDYHPDIYRKNNRRLSVFNEKDKQTIKKLAGLDGAVIIDEFGYMLHYGATLVHSQRITGHGKRHAFAAGTSRWVRGAVCILASEEDNHIRAFRDGLCFVDIDAKTSLSITTRQKVAEFLDTPLTKTLIASGIATSVLTLNPIPAIITISGSYVIVSEGFSRIRTMFSKR